MTNVDPVKLPRVKGVTLAPAEGEQGETVECGNEAEGESDETQDSKVAPNPSLPSAAEVEEHRITHLPFRSWCRECIIGKALGEQRSSSSRHAPSKIAVIGVDYFLMTEHGLLNRKELMNKYPMSPEGEEDLATARRDGAITKCVIIRCSATKMIFAHVVPIKGTGEEGHVCDLIASDIQFLGHTKLILKADNEPALQKVITETIRRLRITVEDLDSLTRENPEPYESQSNGLIEVGVRNLRGQFRTLRACLECRIGRKVPTNHAIAAWLLEHCCLLLNALRVGEDGQTAWMRTRGRPFRPRLVGFGESVMFKLPIKGPRHDAAGNMGPRWGQGIFVGYSRDSNGYLISTAEGIKSSRALMRRPLRESLVLRAHRCSQRHAMEHASSIRAEPPDGAIRGAT